MDFIIENYELIITCFLCIMTFILGYIFGSISSIRQDIKSLDYDKVVAENNLLRNSIYIKKSNKH